MVNIGEGNLYVTCIKGFDHIHIFHSVDKHRPEVSNEVYDVFLVKVVLGVTKALYTSYIKITLSYVHHRTFYGAVK